MANSAESARESATLKSPPLAVFMIDITDNIFAVYSLALLPAELLN